MAGTDYAGFAINFITEAWTNMGYIKDGKELISFHKSCDSGCEILSVSGQDDDFLQHPGVARYKDWWITYGYTDVCPKEFLKQYFEDNKKPREAALFNRILKNKQTV